AKGYPGSYDKGQEISGLEMVSEDENTIAFHAGTALKDGKSLTNGGRVVGVTSVAPTLEAAIIRAYEGVNKIYFEGMYCRRDIASKGRKDLT
ncbi:MAG: phosphoribosylamine--glycine ligase, partial [Acidobacteria bacterium]|nr:phosphoribosylamine--glycine ligase [Acidobacteriota bacterium]